LVQLHYQRFESESKAKNEAEQSRAKPFEGSKRRRNDTTISPRVDVKRTRFTGDNFKKPYKKSPTDLAKSLKVGIIPIDYPETRLG
jgi:hypothetical protein